MTKKYVYSFREGNAQMRNLLGGKGANLAEMVKIGLPVPMGFTITTEACLNYYEEGEKISEDILSQIFQALDDLEKEMGKKLGDNEDPLLVSVRSGAVISMPGMMDTILNLGLNDESVKGLAAKTGNERFAYDSYRRFIQMFGDVVMEVEHDKFESIINEVKQKKGITQDTEMDADGWKEVIELYKEKIKDETGRKFPQDPKEQLLMAVEAVFKSWNNQRAKVYRRINKIPDDLGTAVNVQTMVFGNKGDDSGTGVAFTRNPSTGEKEVYGEFLMNAQGEDVVAGIRTPQSIKQLKDIMPDVYEQFINVCKLLEKHYRDMQDIEFTIENGKLFMLQTRSGKRTAQAAVKIAVDMVKEGLINKDEAILRVPAGQVETLLHRRIDPNADVKPIAKGLPASPGAASGHVVFDPDEAEAMGNEGQRVILVRTETTPDDIHGIVAAQGVLTSRGGMTSHAAVVARGMGKPCVSGCEAVKIDYEKGEFTVGQLVVKKGDVISIDGSTGEVMIGEVPMIDPELSDEFNKILSWADEIRKLKVRANADTPHDAKVALEFGAEGIGLCRTEHMFMAQDRLPIVQQMIMAETKEEREEALAKLLPIQQEDFEGIFEVMEGLPVTVRLLDPPLHEFLPNPEELIVEIMELKAKGCSKELQAKQEMLKKVRALREMNPMLGLRGCRLGLLYPEIYVMQVKAILKAACNLTKKGIKVIPEIEIPLVNHELELKTLREIVEKTAEEVFEEEGTKVHYFIGTMIELPRACLTAEEIANFADFFSFGTNDLTQTTFGFSRDDAEGKILPHYVEQKILSDSPFIVLDRKGVGSLMKMATDKGRSVKPDLLIGICGEHGGEPSSVEFCHMIGLDFVSCSPFRVPIARLAAAQAKINHK
ncbi:Pyruvate, phosphate dikinase [Tepidanaerobacter acetatoxydans Re1]|uniref:Pyruvate, phosphate dikinase n=1 Tax=Tepidanaerobacter acetatoxydans (strain DSM 21804 / JCM 16047 / Re1) TaxID=1209989 RepID=F4LSZ5_TEPAE|nr:pyruvate, phosphate dikinase [Tepidanaerobacter acetatoxydans]AEE91264.1 pyruvate, phosphate dikinase [Tepidanaerobacter acetatoxydans Re1]CDI40611.1 Pyruvate, phosphate dikinase [Tepidanaerobacter acetatoxydans Re1]